MGKDGGVCGLKRRGSEDLKVVLGVGSQAVTGIDALSEEY